MGPVDRLNFDLLILRSGDGYQARVIRSPGGEGDVAFALPDRRVSMERLLRGPPRSQPDPEAAPYVMLGQTGRPRAALAMADFGRHLFRSVFAGPVGLAYRRSLTATESQGQGLRIRLRLTEAPELLELPWELLYDDEIGAFIASSNRTPLIRYLDMPQPLEPLAVDGPLRMLVVISSPNDRAPLDIEAEWSRLTSALHALVAGRRVSLERLETATLSELRRALVQGGPHVLHYIGHGGFDERRQQGLLALEAEDQSTAVVQAEDLSDLLAENDSLRLVVLNSCEGARGSVVDPFAGTAQALVGRGIPAVLAMQFEVTDGAAVGFAQGFYTSVAGGSPIDDALTQARLSMLTEGDGSEWATPVLYTHTDETRIFDVATVAASETSPGGVEALPGGGRIVAGEVIVQVDPDLGVRLDPNDDRIVPRPRPAPVAVLPPPFPLLLGRDGEMARALNGGPGAMLEFIAQPGFGKTALLRALAYRAVGSAPGGLLFLRVVSRPAMDVLQFLFERLFETAVRFKPTEEQIAPWMAPIEATVVLDDVGFGPEEMAAIMRAAPRCRFILAGPGGAAGEQVVPLRGVPVEAGITLIELAMGRTLNEVERADAARMCEEVGGSPGRILGAAEWAWEHERPLSEVVAALRPQSPQADRVAELSIDERAVLGVLAAVDPAPVHASHLVEVAGLLDPAPVLESLERRGLVSSSTPLYSLAFPATGPVRASVQAAQWGQSTFEHLLGWAEDRATPGEVLRDADVLLTAIGLGRDAARDREVIRLARAVEGPLIAGRRWGQWQLVLQGEMAAAVAAASLANQAWAYHQLGSRSLGVGDRATARQSLNEALRIRQSIGDATGAEATRHNLELAGGAPTEPPRDGGGGGRGGPRPSWILGTLSILAVIGFLVWFFGFRDRTARPPLAEGTPVRFVAPIPVEFGELTVRTDSTLALVVSNTGGGTMTVKDVSLVPFVDAFSLDNGCGGELRRGETCTIEVTFAPREAGLVRANLVITDDTGGAPELVHVSGTGTPEPVAGIEFDPPAIEFGAHTIGTEPARQTVVATSTGQADLHISDVIVEGDPAFRIRPEGCLGVTLPPGDSCTIELAFLPQGRGPALGQVVVVDDAGTERQTVALSGAGLTGQPDLLVVSFRQTGEPSPGRLGMPVPVELVVRNEADVLAGVFKVSVEYSSGSLSPGQAFTVPFIADESEDVDPGDGLYAFTTHDLEPGEEITFTGVVLIPNEEQGRTVTVTAIADSCSGEEFTEATCRVAEFNEDNNRSESIDIDVPNFVD